ncbi:aminotransferase class I/II-fold pyridoxal phosphate-dependent enzyme [Sulfurihydrogenibium sp.]|uniref:aminotransferase class I/II-fold pyridoxal phosphate-dependent enzyme n=1 Tax=Sulfurihydrogenibium sp. TaxID=2053621 RepID=UPI002629022D|nr:aminotransferase class I/II-fold pyridoxal phosphate-dependent enzyme [Sulfurihydrogenibium sp.]
MSKKTDVFKAKISEYLSLDNVFLFWKGRVALYAILKAIGIKEGDEVILPAFTCVVAVNPIIYLGAKPIYIDIEPDTFNIDPQKIENKITKRTKAIIAQNTFGLPANIDLILEIAKRNNIFVIEDCAHGFGGTYKGKKNGTVADAAFYSTQWNKPFSTGLGGIAVTTNSDMAEKLRKLEKKAIQPSFKETFLLKGLLNIREKLLSSNTYWVALKTYRFLSEKNLIIGSSQGYELEKPVMPPDFLKGFSDVQAEEGIKYFEKVNNEYKIDKLISHRKKIASLYKKIIIDLGFEPPFEPDYTDHTYLRFPLLVKDRNKFFRLAQDNKIELGDWFLSPIHPITSNFEFWYYRYGENPISEYASKHIVNLPTHSKINEDFIDKVYEFLKKNKDEIIGCYLTENLIREET